MPSEIKYFPVNWVDGMKISKNHLQALQQAVDDQVRDSVATAHLLSGFGLLPSGTKNIDLSAQADHGNLHFTVRNCLAITPDGCRIQVTEDSPLTRDISTTELLGIHNLTESDETLFYVVISVNPFKRIPFGNPAENELPPRNPFALPEHTLDIVSAATMNLNQFEGPALILGKLFYKKGEFRLADGFIPACTCVRAHPGLIDYYNNMGRMLSQIIQNSFLVLQKIRSKDQKTTLGTSIYLLAEKLGLDTSSGMPQYKYLIPGQSPVHLLAALMRIPGAVSDALAMLTPREKEEMLSYLGEWSNLAPGELESRTLGYFGDFPYIHHDPMLALSPLREYVNLISDLMSVLAQLEFIGKKKGQSVFIVEHEVARENADKVKSRWSPLS